MQTLICQMPSSSITGMLCSLLTTNLSSAVSTYDAGSLNYYLTTTTKKELLDLHYIIVALLLTTFADGEFTVEANKSFEPFFICHTQGSK